MDAVLWKGKSIQDHSLTLLSPFFNVRLRLSYIPILDNSRKNQVILCPSSCHGSPGKEEENKELRIVITLQDSFNITSMNFQCGLAYHGCNNKKSSAWQDTRNNIKH